MYMYICMFLMTDEEGRKKELSNIRVQYVHVHTCIAHVYPEADVIVCVHHTCSLLILRCIPH